MFKPKKCKECGKEFIPVSARQLYCKDDHYRPCPICGKPVKVVDFKSPQRVCSIECGNIQRKRTNLKRYGVEDAGNMDTSKAKRKRTNLKRYGVEHPAKLDEIKEKQKTTMLERYGVDNAMKSEEIKEKAHQTVLERYGVDNVHQSAEIIEKANSTNLKRYGSKSSQADPEVRKKSEETCMKRFGYKNAMLNPEIKLKAKRTNLQKYGVPAPYLQPEVIQKAKESLKKIYGVEYPGQSKELRNKGIAVNIKKYGHPYPISGQISKLNRAFAEELTKQGIENQLEFHLGKFSYDICLPNLKTVIEVNPTYTHNAIGNHWGTGVANDYHLQKSRIAEENGYRCIHIFDWDDVHKILCTLQKKRKVHARDCKIAKLNAQDTTMFCEMYHLQGTCRGQEECYALMYQDEIVELMTFGKARYNQQYQWELLRLCSEFKTSVIGGASKLWKHFIDEHHPQSVISYCDIAKFKGNIYTTLGFTLLRTNSPKRIWSKGSEYYTDTFLNQRGYDQIFNTNYGKGTSNETLMIEHGWLPVYDCGQAVYTWTQ